MKAILDTTEITNICVYHDAYDLVYEHTEPEEWESLSHEEQENLKHLTDWEYQDFIVINNEEVIATDRLTGDVVGYTSVEEFLMLSFEAAKEED